MKKPRLSLIMNDKALFTAAQKRKLPKIQNELLQIRNAENLEFKKFMWQLSQRNKPTKTETNGK